MSEWRPIETAPKDGTQIIIARPTPEGAETTTAYWTGRAWWMPVLGDLLDKDALKTGVGGYDYRAFAAEPTLWMPLPEPPTSPLPE